MSISLRLTVSSTSMSIKVSLLLFVLAAYWEISQDRSAAQFSVENEDLYGQVKSHIKYVLNVRSYYL